MNRLASRRPPILSSRFRPWVRWTLVLALCPVLLASCGPSTGDGDEDGSGDGSGDGGGGETAATETSSVQPRLYIDCQDDTDCDPGLSCFTAGPAHSISFKMCSAPCQGPTDCPESPTGWSTTCIHPYGADAAENTGDGGGAVHPDDGGWHCALQCAEGEVCPPGMSCYPFGTFVGDICDPLQG